MFGEGDSTRKRGKSTGLGGRHLGSWGLWAGHFTTQNLSLPNCIMGMIMYPPRGETKNLKCLAQCLVYSKHPMD